VTRLLGLPLLARALEHDKPSLLFQLVCDHLRVEKIVRPGVTLLERLVMAARERGHGETFRRLVPLFTNERLTQFDSLLIREESLGRTPLAWLGQRAAANTSKAIVAELKKLDFLSGLGAAGWDLSEINSSTPKGGRDESSAACAESEAARVSEVSARASESGLSTI
jgi:Domain of unknown function (DUF4158)